MENTESSLSESSLSEQLIKDQLESHSGKDIGGGLPVIEYWAKNTLSSKGIPIWKTLSHKSACLSCAWGTGGQKGGFTNEAGEKVQRCMKSMESIIAELQPPVKPHFFEEHSIDNLQRLSSMEADRLGRLSFPVMLTAGESHYKRITWNTAYELMAKAFGQPPERVAAYSSGRSSNEAAYLLQLMMRLLGSNNLADCSDLCHRPSTTGLSSMFGSGTSTVSLESLKQTDCVVLVGSNAPANHPRLMNELIKVRDRGGTILVINPIREVGLVKYGSPSFPVKSLIPGSDIANLFLQPIPGSDLALFVGIQKSLIERNLIDRGFLQNHTEGWEAVVEQAQQTKWKTLTEICGISKTDIEAAATLISQAEKVVFAWAMGITHQANGTDNVCGIANTALLTGNIGKMGAGVMPIRGHSNVQGFGSMGVKNNIKPALREALEKITGCPLRHEPGYHTRALIEAADTNKVDTLFCLGGNFYAANPDLTEAKRALSRIDTVIYVATKPNLGHFHGLGQKQTLILPVFNRFENPHKTTVESGNNFVRLNDEGKSHLDTADIVSEVHLLTELAHRIHGDSPINWRKLQDTHYVRELIAKTIPGYQKIGEIDKTKAEFTIAGRIFTTPTFKTDSGKAHMPLTPLPHLSLPTSSELGNQPGTVLTLITARSYRQHNTIVYKAGDKYRGMPHRQCILMNLKDIEANGFSNHQRVTVQGSAGKLSNIEIISGAIRPGAALMFYPEANVLMKAVTDPKSHTPAFKRVPVLVHK